MNEWFETHPFLKQMRRRLSVELAVCLLLFCGVFLAARYAGLASAGADAVLGKKKPVVFLDAGHGDFDPGKVSVDGHQSGDREAPEMVSGAVGCGGRDEPGG